MAENNDLVKNFWWAGKDKLALWGQLLPYQILEAVESYTSPKKWLERVSLGLRASKKEKDVVTDGFKFLFLYTVVDQLIMLSEGNEVDWLNQAEDVKKSLLIRLPPFVAKKAGSCHLVINKNIASNQLFSVSLSDGNGVLQHPSDDSFVVDDKSDPTRPTKRYRDWHVRLDLGNLMLGGLILMSLGGFVELSSQEYGRRNASASGGYDKVFPYNEFMCLLRSTIDQNFSRDISDVDKTGLARALRLLKDRLAGLHSDTPNRYTCKLLLGNQDQTSFFLQAWTRLACNSFCLPEQAEIFQVGLKLQLFGDLAIVKPNNFDSLFALALHPLNGGLHISKISFHEKLLEREKLFNAFTRSFYEEDAAANRKVGVVRSVVQYLKLCCEKLEDVKWNMTFVPEELEGIVKEPVVSAVEPTKAIAHVMAQHLEHAADGIENNQLAGCKKLVVIDADGFDFLSHLLEKVQQSFNLKGRDKQLFTEALAEAFRVIDIRWTFSGGDLSFQNKKLLRLVRFHTSSGGCEELLPLLWLKMLCQDTVMAEKFLLDLASDKNNEDSDKEVSPRLTRMANRLLHIGLAQQNRSLGMTSDIIVKMDKKPLRL